MDPGWQPYQDPLMGRPAQFNTGLASHPPQLGSKYGQPPQSQPPVGYTYETFQTPTTSKAPSTGPNSKPVSMASSPTATPRTRDYLPDTDTTMEDADPYNRAKYPSRPNHHSRPSSQFLGQAESESSAARRYSPMNALSSPTGMSSYPTSPGKSQPSYAFSPTGHPQSRRSPTRAAPDYASPPQGYQSPPCESPPAYLCLCLCLTKLISFLPIYSQSAPQTSPASGNRCQPGSILPTIGLLPHESRICCPWLSITSIWLIAIAGSRSRSSS